MHLVYDTRTGDILDGPVTGGGWGPEGIPDEAALVNVAEADREHAAVLRLPDADAGGVLTLATTHRLRVEDGQVVAGDPLPAPPEPEPSPPSQAEQIAALQATVDMLVLDALMEA